MTTAERVRQNVRDLFAAPLATPPPVCEVCESLTADYTTTDGRQTWPVVIGRWRLRLCLDCMIGAPDALGVAPESVRVVGV